MINLRVLIKILRQRRSLTDGGMNGINIYTLPTYGENMNQGQILRRRCVQHDVTLQETPFSFD
jgi:hypothetical protein